MAASASGKEMSSFSGSYCHLPTQFHHGHATPLPQVPTENLISFDDDLTSATKVNHNSSGVRASMETEPPPPEKCEKGALQPDNSGDLVRHFVSSSTSHQDDESRPPPSTDICSSLTSTIHGTCTTVPGKGECKTNSCRSDDHDQGSHFNGVDANKPVKLCGYLDKLGEKGLLKSFKTRWFVFDDERCRLYYYRSAQDVTTLGSIDVANSSLTFDVTNSGGQCQFQIQTDGRTYILQAKDQHTMMFWLQELQERRRAFSSLQTSLSKERSLTRLSVLQPCSGLVSTQKILHKMAEHMSDSEIPPVMDYVEPPMHSVGEATAIPNSRTGMFSLSLTNLKTDLRHQISSLGIWKSPSSETPPDMIRGQPQNDSAKPEEQNKQKSSSFKEATSHIGVAKAVFKKKLSNSSGGSPSSAVPKPSAPSTTWFEHVPDFDCKTCQQFSEEMRQLNADLSQVKRNLSESTDFNDFLQKQLTASQMQMSSSQEFSLCKSDKEKLLVIQRKDKQLIQLEQLLQEIREDRDSFKDQLCKCEKKVEELQDHVSMFTDLIQAKDEVVISLTMRVNELEKTEPLIIRTHSDLSPAQTPEIEGNINLSGNTPADIVEHASLNTHTYVDPLEYERLKDSVLAFETQNKFLNKEILELNQLRNDTKKREQNMAEKLVDLEAEYCRTESKYLLLLNELKGPQRDQSNIESDDIITKLLAEAMDSEVNTKSTKSYAELSREQLYDKYGFISQEETQLDEESPLVSQAAKFQRRSEEIKSKRSAAEVSRGVKWENYLVAHPEKELVMTPELKSLIRGGVPHEYRTRIWKWCVNNRVKKDKETTGVDYYQKLLNSKSFKSSPATKQIELDLLRTLPSNRHYDNLESHGTPKLRRVLLAYSVHNPAIGYCQGLNRVAAIALLYLEEEDAFWCLIAIVEYIMPMDYYSKTLIGSQTDQRVFRELLAEKFPRLNAHFDEHAIDLSLITFNWFVTCFCDNIPAETMLRIWDTFLSEGNKVLFRYALAAFKLFEEELLRQHDYLKIFAFLRRMPEMLTDVQRLTQIAFDELNPFPRRHINNKRTIHRAHVKQQLDELEAIRAEFVPRHSQNGDQMASDGEEEYDTVEALGSAFSL